MKKVLAVFMAIALALGFSGIAAAAISGTAHDFSGETWADSQICLPCHTPHHADTSVDDAPLWNHEVTAQTYTLYDSSTFDASSTIGQPTGVSKLCLSCHDATVAIDSFGGDTGSTTIDAEYRVGASGSLETDHPISFTYDAALATADGELATPVSADYVDAGNVLPLFSASLQCATCHDVHATGTAAGTPLLRITDAGSALCLECHTK